MRAAGLEIKPMGTTFGLSRTFALRLLPGCWTSDSHPKLRQWI